MTPRNPFVYVVSMPMTENRTAFETEPCPRCGGGGWYSHCQTWGHTCFECGVKPHQQGLGRRLTRRGRAAHDYYVSLLPTRCANGLQPGDVILDSTRWRTVQEVRPTTCAFIRDGVRVSEGYLDIGCGHITLCLIPEDKVFSLRPSAEERDRCLEQALTYQITLTKRGTVRKTPLRPSNRANIQHTA